MDFDSIITFVFLLVFFILPSILKMVAKKKPPKGKTPKATKAKKKKPSIFDKIGEGIQNFIRELEEQARQQEKAEKQDLWEAVSEADGLPEEDGVFPEDEAVFQTDAPPPLDPELLLALEGERDSDLEMLERWPEKDMVQGEVVHAPAPQRQSAGYRYRDNPLQNAVVWTEILGKPVALRDQ